MLLYHQTTSPKRGTNLHSHQLCMKVPVFLTLITIGVINLFYFGYFDRQKMDISLQFVFLKVDQIYGQKFLIWICISLIHMLISNLYFFSMNCLFISFIHFLLHFSFFLLIMPTLSHYIYFAKAFSQTIPFISVCVCELTSQACAERLLQSSWDDSQSHGLGWPEAERRAVSPRTTIPTHRPTLYGGPGGGELVWKRERPSQGSQHLKTSPFFF